MVSAKNFEIDITRVAAGGDGIGVDDNGRVVFVPGAIPGDRVAVTIRNSKKKFANAQILHVVDASPGRQAPPCRHVSDGCGGCDWQHATDRTQSEMRLAIVVDSLRRIGRLDADLVTAVVKAGPPLDGSNYRTTVRALVTDGRAGFRMASSHDAVTVDSCLTAHPMIEELLVSCTFGAASEVTIRVGANTGERMVLASPTTEGVVVPDGVLLVGQDELDRGESAFIHEDVSGKRFRISAQSFFQCRPDGAAVLAQLAADAIADVDGPLLDAYCGVGLFGSICGEGREVTGVELNPHAIADATVNLDGRARLFTGAFESWKPASVAAVIADPARAGLGKTDATILAATGASVIVLVSCDPASLGRDAGLLTSMGYQLEQAHVVDLFGQTSHVECVSRFVLDSAAQNA